MLFSNLLQLMPRHVLQYTVKYAILMQHGVDSFRVSNAAKRSKCRRIHAMHTVHKNRTGQPWDKPGHDDHHVILGALFEPGRPTAPRSVRAIGARLPQRREMLP